MKEFIIQVKDPLSLIISVFTGFSGHTIQHVKILIPGVQWVAEGLLCAKFSVSGTGGVVTTTDRAFAFSNPAV